MNPFVRFFATGPDRPALEDATTIDSLYRRHRLRVMVAITLGYGLAEGFGAPSGIVSLAQWFSNRERGRYYGVWSTAHSIGEGLTFVIAGAIGILAALGILWLLRDRPRTLGLPAVEDWRNDHWQGAAKSAEAHSPRAVLLLQLSVLRIPAIWVLALASALMYVTRYAINSWGVLYLQEHHGYSLVQASSLLMINTLAGIAGCLAYGFMSDTLFDARRPPTNLLFAIVELIGLMLIFYGPPSAFSLTLAFILYGVGLNGLVTALGGLFAVDIAPKRVAGAVMGVIGIFSYIGAALQEQVSGALIEAGMSVTAQGRTYDFGPVILFWIGSSVLSCVLATSLWRTRLRD